MATQLPGFIKILIPTLLLPALGAFVGIATQSGVDDWYQTIAKSVLTPPNWVFGAMWSTLYVLMGISLGLLWNTPPGPRRKNIIILFIGQLLFNLAWSFAFFQLHLLWISTVWVAALAGLVLVLIIKAWAIKQSAALLLIPYLLWLCFAFYLSLTVALLN